MTRILAIDDEESIRLLLRISLAHKGYEVTLADDGAKGIELFKQERPPIVLTDIKMPGIDGIEVLRRIKEIDPEAEVIVITGHGDMESAIKALQLDASDFITKPIKDEVLVLTLKRAEEKLSTRQKLKEYTTDLEKKVKESTEVIRERYEFEGKLIHHCMDGIIATDSRGNIITFNKGAEIIFGYLKDEVTGKMDIGSLCSPEIGKKIQEGLHAQERARADMNNWEETFVLGKDGERIPVRFSGALLRHDGEVIGSVGFFHDLREIKQLQQVLLNSERMVAIGQTVAGLAHCIKNIVTALEGGVYIISKALRKGDMGKLSTGWGMIENNIGKISGLVLDLLSYTKERKLEYATSSPNAIAEEVCNLMDPQAKEYGVEIVRDFDPAAGTASLDPKGIHRCLLNLVSNAVDACQSDEDRSKEHMVRLITGREGDEAVVFTVSDNGCGMDEGVKKQIFRSFFSTKKNGTGLGLLVTQKIVHEHGGTITVDSENGKWSAFTIRLPCKHR